MQNQKKFYYLCFLKAVGKNGENVRGISPLSVSCQIIKNSVQYNRIINNMKFIQLNNNNYCIIIFIHVRQNVKNINKIVKCTIYPDDTTPLKFKIILIIINLSININTDDNKLYK